MCMTPSSNIISRISQSQACDIICYKSSHYHFTSMFQGTKAEASSSKSWLRVKGTQQPNHDLMTGLNPVQQQDSETFNIT